jgi:hypothetical protein
VDDDSGKRLRAGPELDANDPLTYRCGYTARVVSVAHVVVGLTGCGVAAFFVVQRDDSALSHPLAFAGVFLVVGMFGLIRGIGDLRSKVVVDAAGMHIRRLFGWQHLEWSIGLGFVVEKFWTRFARFHSVVIVRAEGRYLRPFALLVERREDAEFIVLALEARRSEASSR